MFESGFHGLLSFGPKINIGNTLRAIGGVDSEFVPHNPANLAMRRATKPPNYGQTSTNSVSASKAILATVNIKINLPAHFTHTV